jgi:pimeloyl-ACP methyl ester carboxylesterase
VTADTDKNGVAHAFAITRPTTPLPATPLSCVFAMHGGGDHYQLFRPGEPARANMQLRLTDGIVVSPDDAYYIRHLNALELTETNWFGYTPWCDPFSSAAWTEPPNGSVVVNYTQRRVHWILEWLLSPNSPYLLDPTRVAMVGHSMGARGTSHLTRLRPERFCAAVMYCPPLDLTQPPAPGQASPMRGGWPQNLPTNLLDSAGNAIGFTDVIYSTSRLSLTQRDIPLTRTYSGKRDEQGAAEWNPVHRQALDDLNDTHLGYMIHWDEREHGVEMWHLETNDATDGHAGPWPDVAQWIAPNRTGRCTAQYLVDSYRSDRSFPAFFNSDHDTAVPGRQPDPGAGDPSLGAAYGTWGGYFDWVIEIDSVDTWRAQIFATGLSAIAIDNAPVASITTSLAPRRSMFSVPQAGTVQWDVSDDGGVVTQSGRVLAGAEGVVEVHGVAIPRDPARIRLTLIVVDCGTSDYNGDGDFGTDADIEAFFACLGGSCCGTCFHNGSDFNGDGDFGTDQDIESFFRVLAGGTC